MNGLYEFLTNNSIFIVLFIVLIVWGGIFAFVWSTDKRLKAIEEELKENNVNEK